MARAGRRERDVAAFDRRAGRYDDGPLGQWHRDVGTATLDLALTRVPPPRAVLDVGCGTGLLLAALHERAPGARIAGIDPAAGMLARAAERVGERAALSVAAAEALPFPDGSFDLLLSVTSFDHWADQLAGLREARRVLRPGGTFALTDLCAGWLPRRGRARTPRSLGSMAAAAGFRLDDAAAVVPILRIPLLRCSLLVR